MNILVFVLTKRVQVFSERAKRRPWASEGLGQRSFLNFFYEKV